MNLVNVTNKRKRKNSLPTECSECIESSECSVWFEEIFWLIPSECCSQALAQNYAPNIPYVMNLANVTNKRKIKNSLPTECSECIESSECSVWFEDIFWLIPSECCNQALAQNYAPNI